MIAFDFFERMHDTLAGNNLIKIALAFHEGKPVASALLLCYKGATTYFAGGMDYDAHRLSPHNLLFWETMRWAKAEGGSWYEMGPYFPYLSPEAKMARIGNFKREFGGRAFVLFEGMLVYDWTRYLSRILLEETWARFRAYRHRIGNRFHLRGERT